MATKKLTKTEEAFLDELKEMANFLKAHKPSAKNIYLRNTDIQRLNKIYEKGFKLIITKCNNVLKVDGYEKGTCGTN